MDSGDLEAATRLTEAMAAMSATAGEAAARLVALAVDENGLTATVVVDQPGPPPPREDGLVERELTAEDLAAMVEAELPNRAINNPWGSTERDRTRVIRGKELYLVNVEYGAVAGHCIGLEQGRGAKAERAVATLALKALLDLDEDAFRQIADDESESTENRLTRSRRRQRSR